MSIGVDRRVFLWDANDGRLKGCLQRIKLASPHPVWERVFN